MSPASRPLPELLRNRTANLGVTASALVQAQKSQLEERLDQARRVSEHSSSVIPPQRCALIHPLTNVATSVEEFM